MVDVHPVATVLAGSHAGALGAGEANAEEGRFDAGAGVWSYRIVPAHLGDRIVITGNQRAEEAGAGRCRVTSVLRFDVRMPAVGGLVEKFVAKQFEENLEKQTAFTTIANNPSVISCKGHVRNMSSGRISALTKPSTRASRA